LTTAIWWIRRDIRLDDNQALNAACSESDQVVPVFILDDRLLHSQNVGTKRTAFLYEGLRRLDESLRKIGGYLVVRRGDPLIELSRLVNENHVDSIFTELDYSPFAKRRDQEISRHLPVRWINGAVIHPPGSITKADGTPYTIFTPFLKSWRASASPAEDSHHIEAGRIYTPPGINTLRIPEKPELTDSIPFTPGEVEAHHRLDDFISGPPISWNDQSRIVGNDLQPVYRYAVGRNELANDGTSFLSPYLRFGMISIRQVVSAANKAIREAPGASARQSAEVWLNELVWREFYIHILDHFPQVRKHNFRFKRIMWQNDESDFSTWCAGQTGYPIVDAAMRQMHSSGWMHNRSRMVVASFLTKDLLVDWRWGEKHFMQHLLDGDPASNNGGWQWTAGTGTDAAPYFQIFNPVSQSKKFDPAGIYIRRWLPELANVPNEYIHEPGLMSKDLQEKVGCKIGRDYPAPIVDHHVARERALLAYRQGK
jgi:deoxyribodipyrimidine photo-lyase